MAGSGAGDSLADERAAPVESLLRVSAYLGLPLQQSLNSVGSDRSTPLRSWRVLDMLS